jgi:toxin ParE1/3/4
LNRKLVIRLAAANDIRDAGAWYESQRVGLGAVFVASLDRTLQRITANPEHFPRVYRELRRAPINRFPYSVFFVDNDTIVRVVGCFHGRRKPSVWKKRFEAS